MFSSKFVYTRMLQAHPARPGKLAALQSLVLEGKQLAVGDSEQE